MTLLFVSFVAVSFLLVVHLLLESGGVVRRSASPPRWVRSRRSRWGWS